MRFLPLFTRLLPLLLIAAPWVARAQTWMVTSAVHTVRFGIEEDWPDSVRLIGRHVDLGVYYCGGAGRMEWIAEAPPVASNYPIREAHAYASESNRETMTAALTNEFGFIGAQPGETFWNFSQNFIEGELFLGIRGQGDLNRLVAWNPMDPDNFANFSAKHILIELLDVRGPPDGYFALFQFGPPARFYISTYVDGIDANDRIYYASGGHDHFNWSFTKPGLYELDVRVSTLVTWAMETPFHLETFDLDGPVDVLSWPTQPCTRYRVEVLAPIDANAGWTPLAGATDLSSDAGWMVFTNQTPRAGSQAYRVVAEP